MEMAALWDKMDSLARLADLFQPPAAKPKFNWRYGAVAASLAIVLLSAGIWTQSARLDNTLAPTEAVASTQIAEGIYETAVGEQSSVNLPDGSQLVLNTNSRVHMKYTAEQRLFVLERGEINIEVAHNKSRPLSVMAGDKMVQAVGTAFNVRMHNAKEVALLVTDGKVLVAEHQKREPIDQIKAPRLTAKSLAVSKNEKVVLGTTKAKVVHVNDAEMGAELSWRRGNIVFSGQTLEDALAEISRYTSVQFELGDSDIKRRRIAGMFKTGDIDGLLQSLEQNFGIRSERLDANKVRLSAE
jgi:transmembrane sensor